MAFWKPGAPRPDAPLSLEVDRRVGDSAALLPFNRDQSLGLQQQRSRLPIFALRSALLYLVEHHAVVVVIGATGCGKTTQLPQYLAEAGWAAGGRCVACTQPRRVACQTVAVRVAEEVGCRLGGEVGYSIRFEDCSTPGATRIKFLTDGTLLRELLDDPLLSRYSVIMVDEAHERSLATDVLLGLLKKVIRRRADLRLVVASATMEAHAVAAFFDTRGGAGGAAEAAHEQALSRKPAIVSVEGRTFPVALHYLEAPTDDYVRCAVEAALGIHASDVPGDVLVFLTGQAEIERAVSLLRDSPPGRPGGSLVALPLYAGLSPAAQLAVFAPCGVRGARKVVVASNVAETSVTLEDVVHVVDACFTKCAYYDPRQGVEALMTVPASQASCAQRAGRAGRVRPGACYRLTTRAAYDALPAAPVPEVQRSQLSGVVLQLKALGVDNLLNFEWLAPPPAASLERALEHLYALGALDGDGRLTQPLGGLLAELPLEPALGRALLCSAELGCARELLTVAAALQVQSLWVSHSAKSAALQEAEARFAVAEGDQVTALNVCSAYAKQPAASRAAWCGRNFLSSRALARVADVRAQLDAHLRRAKIPTHNSSAGQDTQPVRRALTAGLFAHAAVLVSGTSGLDGARYRPLRASPGAPPLAIHPSSVLFRCAPQTVVYHTAVQTDKLYMHDVCAIDLDWLPELAPHFFERKHGAK